MALQGAQMPDVAGMFEGLPVAVLSTQARPQREEVSIGLRVNMLSIAVTFATFQLERPPRNVEAR